MSRYTGPVCKLCRREGTKLYLKGDRCYSAKCAIEKRPYPPGQHGQRRGRKPSDFAVRLREKQKLRRFYGVSEKQFRSLFDDASRRQGVTGANFLALLESRLDSVVYRLGIASSRAQARQLINQGHIEVNGKRLDIASFQLKPGMEITVGPKAKKLDFIRGNVEAGRRRKVSPWLEFDADELRGRFLRQPAREDLVVPVNELQVIEYYSR
ncbi:MAG: 30S ribosomal protein S4 [Deinococcota bacterium]|jgi:small subunit ribosomal protein S4|nr:30S ribosomal protein S4 [Deinococcota bacterium]